MHRVVLIRHGETDWSRTGRHTGRTDVPLTAAGEAAARALGEAIRREGWRFALVLTSPRQRASETARLAGLAEGAEVVDDLAEWDYGTYEGRTTPDIREERPGWLLWRDGVPGGESIEELGRRVDRVLERVRAVDGDVALVAHGHVLRVVAARWLGLPPEDGRLFALFPATISVLGWERELAVLERWNAPVATPT